MQRRQVPTLNDVVATPLPNGRAVAMRYNRLVVWLPLALAAYPIITWIGKSAAGYPMIAAVMLTLLAADVAVILWVAIVEGYRLGKLMGDPYMTTFLPLVLLLILPFAFCLLQLLLRTNRRLRAAGVRVGWLGVANADLPSR